LLLGGFCTRDPALPFDDSNPYAYVYAAPTSAIDPLGERGIGVNATIARATLTSDMMAFSGQVQSIHLELAFRCSCSTSCTGPCSGTGTQAYTWRWNKPGGGQEQAKFAYFTQEARIDAMEDADSACPAKAKCWCKVSTVSCNPSQSSGTSSGDHTRAVEYVKQNIEGRGGSWETISVTCTATGKCFQW
jgi:hypothetical protein